MSAWLGFALAALFFYPLAVALDADAYYLQWQLGDVVESIAALAGLTLILASLLFALWPRSGRLSTIGLVAAAALPLASFAAGASRQLPYDAAMRAAWEHQPLRIGLPAAVAGLLGLGLARWPHAFDRWFRRVLVLMSPISLVVFGTFIASAPPGDLVVNVDRIPAQAAQAVEKACTPVLALLFDELSFSYLYGEAGDVRPEFPEIGRFASASTNYLSVAAPGRETLTSLPSFLAARRVGDIRIEDDGIFELVEGHLLPFSATEPEGLFATARRLGFTTEMAGFYLPYCELLDGLADACQSLSFYKLSSPDGEFSPASPVLTTLVLWPRQFPFGLLKNPPFAMLQRTLVEQTTAFAIRPIRVVPPLFRFVHFSVPHLPFVFDAEGYDPPFDPLQTAPDAEYVRQLQYVDRLVGELVAYLRSTGAYEATTVVILSDHGFRFGGRERDPLHIPFIVKLAGQQRRVDVILASGGERLLKEIVERSCAA
ncbi:MAG: sulfatase-like hydrolase/transferase [Acidobacteria bacterium]|nr:sulfatase-like hydrolase/transferase [Acidobacteriota bacterium]